MMGGGSRKSEIRQTASGGVLGLGRRVGVGDGCMGIGKGVTQRVEVIEIGWLVNWELVLMMVL